MIVPTPGSTRVWLDTGEGACCGEPFVVGDEVDAPIDTLTRVLFGSRPSECMIESVPVPGAVALVPQGRVPREMTGEKAPPVADAEPPADRRGTFVAHHRDELRPPAQSRTALHSWQP